MSAAASRFLRPADVARLRRNQRRIQVQQLLLWLRNSAVVLLLAAAATWAWRHTQSDVRFAVKRVEVDGAVHTPAAAMSLVTSRYVGSNLFQIDIGRVQRDLGALGWVSGIQIEKKLPDTLRIRVTEREPAALIRKDERLFYVDARGVAFAELTPTAGNDDLPVISDAEGTELTRTIELLRALRASAPELYSRVSEIRPVPPRGFAVFDRELGAFVYADGDDLAAKWRGLYAIVRAENNPRIEYADLRFADRIIVKPLEAVHAAN